MRDLELDLTEQSGSPQYTNDSVTIYHLRNNLAISNITVNGECGDITISPGKTIILSCYTNINHCSTLEVDNLLGVYLKNYSFCY